MAIGMGCFFVKQAGSAPLDTSACVSLSTLQKAEVSADLMSMSCLWLIFLSACFPRSQSVDSWKQQEA